jgi:hypothetical protein
MKLHRSPSESSVDTTTPIGPAGSDMSASGHGVNQTSDTSTHMRIPNAQEIKDNPA